MWPPQCHHAARSAAVRRSSGGLLDRGNVDHQRTERAAAADGQRADNEHSSRHNDEFHAAERNDDRRHHDARNSRGNAGSAIADRLSPIGDAHHNDAGDRNATIATAAAAGSHWNHDADPNDPDDVDRACASCASHDRHDRNAPAGQQEEQEQRSAAARATATADRHHRHRHAGLVTWECRSRKRRVAGVDILEAISNYAVEE